MWLNTFGTEPDGPYSIIIWEPLETTAPAEAQPHCCYLSMVIFYHQPYTIDSTTGGYAEYDRVQSAWDMLGQRWTEQDYGWASLAPFLLHEGQVYELNCGRVVWRDGRWFLRHPARRVRWDDRRLLAMQKEHRALPAPAGMRAG